MTPPGPSASVTHGLLGILGGGQLGRMLAIAAARLGLKVHIFEPGANPPAGDVAWRVTTAPYDDADAIRAFADTVAVVTYEFENIPTAALDLIEDHVPIRPGRSALAVSQDRHDEKSYLNSIGLKTAPWATVDGLDSLRAAISEVGTPAILKTRRLGYDGKGQVRITDPDRAEDAWAAMNGALSVLEGFVDFEREVSVIGARGLDGAVVCYDPGENVHRDGILHSTTVNATTGRRIKADAVLMAGRILNAIDYVGVMGIEMFVTPDGLLINEIAPRVHNSGHWTIEACVIDQFQQHIRAVAGWPLGDGSRHSDAEMVNLIGADADDWPSWARDGGLHLYGKAEARPGRKMGHVTRLSSKT